MCNGTWRIPHRSRSSGSSREDESVTTTTAMVRADPLGHPGLLQPLEHQFGDRLMGLEVPVDAVGITSAAHDLFGDGGFQIDQRNVVLLRPFGDRLDGARPAWCALPYVSAICTDGSEATMGMPGRLKSIAPRVISRYSTETCGGSAARATGESLGCTQP